jgi:hypothetical protein
MVCYGAIELGFRSSAYLRRRLRFSSFFRKNIFHEATQLETDLETLKKDYNRLPGLEKDYNALKRLANKKNTQIRDPWSK